MRCPAVHVLIGTIQCIYVNTFFAIFNKYPDTWSWNAISSGYRNSPFLTMDEEITKEDEKITKGWRNVK